MYIVFCTERMKNMENLSTDLIGKLKKAQSLKEVTELLKADGQDTALAEGSLSWFIQEPSSLQKTYSDFIYDMTARK